MRTKYCVPAIAWLSSSIAVAQRSRAADILPEATLAPRFYQTASPLQGLGRRQLVGCKGGQHPCDDIGTLGTGFCCPDDTYCIVDPLAGSKAACCALGSLCGSSCSEDQYQCVGSLTIATITPASITTFSACCPRQCTATSMFACPSALGGGCCSYGQTCASNSQCLWTSTPSSTAKTLVSQLPPGCTTSQIACPSSMGGGCCGINQSCTFADGAPRCAAVTTTPTASGISAVHKKAALGSGAKAGIAIGVVLISGMLLGILTWFCLRRRRLRSDIPPFNESRLDPGSPRSPVNNSLPISPHRRPRRTGLGTLLSPGSRPEMTHSNSDTVSHGGRLRGLTADYFGPNAVAGPFTETNIVDAPQGVTDSPGGRNANRAVPMSPQSPDDITAPVEIDSRKHTISETVDGRHELPGWAPRYPGGPDVISPYTPSPVTGTAPFTPGSTIGSYDPPGHEDELIHVREKS